MAKELTDESGAVILSKDEAQVVEAVLGMTQGYVLDFTDATFNAFVRRNWNVDATAPIYTILGTSKANRLRGLLLAFSNLRRADLLEKFLNHRSALTELDPLFSGLERSYREVIARFLEAGAVEEDAESVDSAAWTGRPSIQARIVEVKTLAPVVLDELSFLIKRIEDERLNDPETGEALESLKRLHGAIGELIYAIEAQRPLGPIMALIDEHRNKLLAAIGSGAKVCAVAPAMTLGIAHMLAWMVGAPVDTGLLGTVYASLVGFDALKGVIGKGRAAS